MAGRCRVPVSYTHLDVYKRQLYFHDVSVDFGIADKSQAGSGYAYIAYLDFFLGTTVYFGGDVFFQAEDGIRDTNS